MLSVAALPLPAHPCPQVFLQGAEPLNSTRRPAFLMYLLLGHGASLFMSLLASQGQRLTAAVCILPDSALVANLQLCRHVAGCSSFELVGSALLLLVVMSVDAVPLRHLQ